MKKLLGLLLFGISFIVFVVLYLNYDKKSYYFGYECNFCNEKLPYNLEPKFNLEYPQTFYLLNEDKFELVGIGFRYRGSSFKIKDFVAYGYNDTSVIIKYTDTLNTIKYLISYETGYKSKKGNPEISFKDLSNNDFKRVKDKYQWFEIDEEKADAIWRMKFLFMLGVLLSLLFLILKLFKLRNNKATE
jgi:hypothetical protein